MIYLDYPSISPIIFSIGPFEIRWYSMAYIIGFLFAWQYIKFLSNKKELFGFETNLDSQSVDDLIFYSIIGLIVGARLAYVIFYNGTYYLNNPIHALYVWEGGLSFHGGLVGIIIAIFYIKLKYEIKFYIISDLICSSAPVGIFFGRIANFINGELYGRPSSSFFGMIFPNTDGKIRHPSQLYEAFLEGIIIFLILIIFVVCQLIELLEDIHTKNSIPFIADTNTSEIIPEPYADIWDYILINNYSKNEIILNEQILFHMNLHLKDIDKFK